MRHFIEVDPRVLLHTRLEKMRVGELARGTGLVEIWFDEEQDYLAACQVLQRVGAQFNAIGSYDRKARPAAPER